MLKKHLPVTLLHLLAVAAIVLTGGCWIAIKVLFPPATRIPREFPDTDIVYDAGMALGFINADGTGVVNIPYKPAMSGFSSPNSGNPLITADGQTLVVTDGIFPTNAGNVYIGSRGEYARLCEDWGINYPMLAADGQHVWIETSGGLALHVPEDCGTNNPPKKIVETTQGYLSFDEQYVVVVEWTKDPIRSHPVLTIVHRDTGLKKLIGNGLFAVWSPDSRWVAYTGADGVYIVNAEDKTEPILISYHLNPNENQPLYWDNPQPSLFFPPKVSWSPDGQWLVYSIYREGLGEDTLGSASFYSIYKVNIQTGEETKLIDGGLSPYWR